MRKTRTNIRTHNNRNKQIFKKKIRSFEFIKRRNDCLNVFEINLTRKKIFNQRRFRQKYSIHFFLKKILQKNKHEF